jgi:hypothetical protein
VGREGEMGQTKGRAGREGRGEERGRSKGEREFSPNFKRLRGSSSTFVSCMPGYPAAISIALGDTYFGILIKNQNHKA